MTQWVGPSTTEASPRVNVLLVDDQPANLLALEAILTDPSLNLVRADSGAQALRRLLEDDYAVILLDVQMPGMDGFEAAGLIRERPRSQHTPIILITAFEPSDIQKFKGYSLGAVDYLHKPIVPEVLRSKVTVFAELFRKNELTRRQAEQLRAGERRDHERQLAEERQHWEMDRLRAEAARDKARAEELAEADRRKDEFLAMLAHELRNPLAPIRNALHVLKLEPAGGPNAACARDMAERQLRHLSRLVDDLLDVARINRGKIELRKEPVDLAPAVTAAVEAVRALYETRGHQLEVSLPPGGIRLEADPTRLEQIVANLLNNAAKYTEGNGRIILTVERSGADAVIRVRDNGIGIPTEMLEAIFGLFTQVNRSMSSPTQWGLGIGLALVKNLVEMHGGSVTAHSDGPGHGSEFVVRLPALPELRPQHAEAPSMNGSSKGGRSVRVLVVDDNEDAALSLALLLRLRGHEVTLAHDGPAALAAVAAQVPQVVFLDIGLPRMDGFEVARRLRQMPNLGGMLLVAMTGYGNDADRHRSAQAGFDHHLVKPVEPAFIEELLAFVPPCNSH